MDKFLRSDTGTSRNPDELALVLVEGEEPRNLNDEDQDPLWSTISQERLNGLAILCIEKKLLDEIDINAIIDDFASRNFEEIFKDQNDWHARISSIFWTCTGAEQNSQAVVFVDLVRANTDSAPSTERGFFINTTLSKLGLIRYN